MLDFGAIEVGGFRKQSVPLNHCEQPSTVKFVIPKVNRADSNKLATVWLETGQLLVSWLRILPHFTIKEKSCLDDLRS